MRIHTCSFCSSSIHPGHGNMYVRNDAKTFRYCSSKCDKNSKHKKNPRKTRWTKSFRKINGKELTIDPSFEFERRRNKPIKYNREKVMKAIEIMKQVSEVREKREGKFVMERLRAGRKITLKEAKQIVRKHIHVIRPAAAGLKYKIKDTNKEEGEQSLESKKKNLESALKMSEKDQEDETLPKLLQDNKEIEDSESETEVAEKSSKNKLEGKQKLLEESMDIDYDDMDDDDSEEESDDEDEDTESDEE